MSVFVGSIKLGLAHIPIRLETAARHNNISFKTLNRKNNNPVKQKYVDSKTNQLIGPENLVKGYEVGDTWVHVEDQDILDAKPEGEKIITLDEFVDKDYIDPIYMDSSFYVYPEKGAEYNYKLLSTALADLEVYGIGKMIKSKREYLVCVRSLTQSRLSLHTLYFSKEVKPKEPFTHEQLSVDLNHGNLDIIKGFIGVRKQPKFDHAKYEDSYKKNLIALIEAKAAGIKLGTKKASEDEVHSSSSFAELMKASIELGRK